MKPNDITAQCYYLIARELGEKFPGRTFLPAFLHEEGDGGIGDCFRQIRDRRSREDFEPVIIYSMDSRSQIRKTAWRIIFDLPGVFFLKLPCRFSEIRNVVGQADQYDKSSNGNRFDLKHFTENYVLQIRTVKHAYDNLWMSLRAAIRIEVKKIKEPEKFHNDGGLNMDIYIRKIQKLTAEYKEIEAMATILEIKDIEQAKNSLNSALGKLERVVAERPPKEPDIKYLNHAVEDLQTVSKILGKILEYGLND